MQSTEYRKCVSERERESMKCWANAFCTLCSKEITVENNCNFPSLEHSSSEVHSFLKKCKTRRLLVQHAKQWLWSIISRVISRVKWKIETSTNPKWMQENGKTFYGRLLFCYYHRRRHRRFCSQLLFCFFIWFMLYGSRLRQCQLCEWK